MGAGIYFPGGKTAGAWSWTPQSNSKVRNTWIYTYTSPHVFMACSFVTWRLCFHGGST